uniref:Putative retrotransposon nucleocapsid protein n=1 Tax=Ustilago esculenta TaxID=185366 RepID=A0A481SG12_9BASI|nr:putative retrotransposon nucleocapsid protein [Ustilago esculenta]
MMENNLAEMLDKLIQLVSKQTELLLKHSKFKEMYNASRLWDPNMPLLLPRPTPKETQALGNDGYSNEDLYSTPTGSRVQCKPAATTEPDKGASPAKNDLKYPFPKFDARNVEMFHIKATTWLNQQGQLFHNWDFFTLRLREQLDTYNKLQGLKMESDALGAATCHVECFRDLESQAKIDDNELIVFLFRNSLTHSIQEKFERNPPEDPWSWYREVEAIDKTFGFVPTGNNHGVEMEVEPETPIQMEILAPYKHLKGVFCEVEADKLPPHADHDLHIELVPGGKPPQGPLYLKGPKEMAELRKYLEENLEKGFIRPSKSPAQSPVTVKNRAPLLLIEEQLFLLWQATIYTKLDLKAAYNLYLVMPFGLANALAQFQSLVNHIYCDIIGTYMVVYLDNFLIFSNSKEEHVAHVQEVLRQLQENWLFMKLSKCTFHTNTVEFLGYIIKLTGIEMDPEKVQAIKEWPLPVSIHDIQHFLGYIANFARITRPLTLLVKPVERFKKLQLDEEAQGAFYKLIKAFTTTGQPWGSISMDFIKGLLPSNGYASMLMVVDRLTKLAILAPTYKTATSQDTAELFRTHVMKQFGTPDHIVSDRGQQFISATWKKFTEALLIKHSLSTAYHPQTDGQTERVNQVVEQYLQMYCNYEQDNWEGLLPMAEFVYNNVVHSSIG